MTLSESVRNAEAEITRLQEEYKKASGAAKDIARARLLAAMDAHAIVARRLCVPGSV
jgi:diacylglycerol kinase